MLDSNQCPNFIVKDGCLTKNKHGKYNISDLALRADRKGKRRTRERGLNHARDIHHSLSFPPSKMAKRSLVPYYVVGVTVSLNRYLLAGCNKGILGHGNHTSDMIEEEVACSRQ